MSATVPAEPVRREALAASAAASESAARYTLPPELDRRVLELGERKETLTADERAELLAWVAFTQQRSVARLKAEVALGRLVAVFPELANPTGARSRNGISLTVILRAVRNEGRQRLGILV